MGQKKVDFFVKGFSVRGAGGRTFGKVPPFVVKMIAELEKLTFKELLTTRSLQELMRVSMDHIRKYTSDPNLASHKFQRCRGEGSLWGSKRTIRELKRQMEKQ